MHLQKLLKFPDDTMVDEFAAEKPFGFFAILEVEKIKMEQEKEPIY